VLFRSQRLPQRRQQLRRRLDRVALGPEALGEPDEVRVAESFGARGYAIESASELLPTLRKALDDDAVSVIAVPVDYTENARLVERLGALDEPV